MIFEIVSSCEVALNDKFNSELYFLRKPLHSKHNWCILGVLETIEIVH